MCVSDCTCRACNISNMSWHPAFKDRIDNMIHEYQYTLYGASYFPIELAVQGANLGGLESQNDLCTP